MSSPPSLDLRGGRLDFLVAAGRVASFIIPFPDGEDLSTFDWVGQVRDSAGGELLGEFDFDFGEGQVGVTLAPEVTAALPARSVYDIVLSAEGVPVTTLLWGSIEPNPGVTE